MNLLPDDKKFYPGVVNSKLILCPLVVCRANSGSFQIGNRFNNEVVPKPYRCTRTENTHAQEVRHEIL